MSECDSSNHPVSVIAVIVIIVFTICLYIFRLLSNHCTDVPQILYGCSLGWTPTKSGKIRILALFFMELWVFVPNSLKNLFYKNLLPEIIHIWFGEFQENLVSSLLKLGRCDLYFNNLKIFVKHIFNFISNYCKDLGEHLDHICNQLRFLKFFQINFCMTYFHQIMLMNFLVVT